MLKTYATSLGLVFILMATAASAGFGHRGGGAFSYADSRFWIADSDNNGYIDRQEAQSKYALGLASVFDKVDNSHDGKIYRQEFRQFVNIERCQLVEDAC